MNIEWFFNGLTILFFIYAGGIMFWYTMMAIVSSRAIKWHLKESNLIHYRQILSSPLAPHISLLAPAYNEGLNIVGNVRSLLSLEYSNLEVVIINDGSKDDSMEQLIESYELIKVPYFVPERVPCKKIKGVYKSRKKAFQPLIVIDKENGGKSDALNAGINASSGRLITCVDVDTIIEPDALLRMVKPFLTQYSDEKMIATGGVVRIANNCTVKDGRLMKIRLPEKWIARFQVLEYMRAFLLGRMGWSKMNGLLIISGAFGMFDKQLVVDAGGYCRETVGEDMELVIRMRRIMEERNEKYRVGFIPDPLCWTECPENWNVLGRQRNRWTRGTMDSILFHRKMLFNPRYGILGTLSMPYWVFYEWLAPVIELTGLLLTIFFYIIGWINWPLFVLLFLFVYSFSVMISLYAIFIDQNTYMQYREANFQWKLFLCALAEPFVFHPFIVYHALRGNWDYFRGKQSWGSMTRKGLGNTLRGG